MKPLIIFGNLASASTSRYYIQEEGIYEVIAFTVDAVKITAPKHEGLPVVAFEIIQKEFPPNEVNFLFPAGYQLNNPINTNIFRRTRFELIKSMGYGCINYVSRQAMVASNIELGENVLIYEGAIIQPFVKIGDNTIIRSGANIGHHVTIGSHSFIAAEVTIGGQSNIGEGVFIGLNSTISNSIQVADGSFVGANSFINKDTQISSKNIGIPAKIY